MLIEPQWYSFQEEIAAYFKSLGTNAETNKPVQGVRTKHKTSCESIVLSIF